MNKLIILGLLVTLLIVGGCNNKTDEEILSDICKSLGYSELTDFNFVGVYSHKIECDGKIIDSVFRCSIKKQCIEIDKWGDCIDDDRVKSCDMIREVLV